MNNYNFESICRNTNCIDINSNKNLFSNKYSKKFNYTIENLLYNDIIQCCYEVIQKKDIISKYNISINGFNNVILGPNFIITIQDKWVKTEPTQNEIINFIKATKQIGLSEPHKNSQGNFVRGLSEPHKYCLGIFISKIPISPYNLLFFEQENLSQVNKFISIQSNTETQVLQELRKILYTYGIYYYELDGSVVMLD
jgi:hypothetical protein